MPNFLSLISKCLGSIFFRGAIWSVKNIFPGPFKIMLDAQSKASFQKGYKLGKTEGKNTWEITDSRKLEVKPRDVSIYGPDRLKVTEVLRAEMRRKVEAAVAQRLISMPSDEQWPMIFCDNPSARIFAGAGSGKSTTLVLRVIFMICHLEFPLNEISVISFTKDSCNELREKIQKVILFWGKKLSENDLKSLVRTYHSVLYKLSRAMLPGALWFENISSASSELDDVENPLTSSKLSDEQVEILKKAYHKAYSLPAFRKHVRELLNIEINKIRLKPPPEGIDQIKAFAFKQAKNRDLVLVRKIGDLWQAKTRWPIQGIEAGVFPSFSVDGASFFANGKIIATGEFIFLGGVAHDDSGVIGEGLKLEGGENFTSVNVTLAASVKRKIINAHCDSSVFYVNSERDLAQLEKLVEYIKPSEFSLEKAPMFSLRLPGDIYAKIIYEAFFTEASFIESLGLDVVAACARIEFKAKLEYHFNACLVLFWKVFYDMLHDEYGMLTFNAGFQIATENLKSEKCAFSLEQLKPYSNLLIDEFQDISPQIVQFLSSLHAKITDFSKSATIMAIGDDWQSIYGWRGSSPGIFLDFDKYFVPHKSLNGSAELCLGTNYRSIAAIVNDAALVLSEIKYKYDKPVRASQAYKEGGHGIRLITEANLEEDLNQVVEEIFSQLEFSSSLPNPDKNKVIVISRSNKSLNQLKSKFERSQDIKFHTIHGSKGLQGEVVVIVGDCLAPETHPFRNTVYKISGFFSNTYDEAMADEAMRLAYVAITRGVSRAVWFSQKTEGASKIIYERTNSQ